MQPTRAGSIATWGRGGQGHQRWYSHSSELRGNTRGLLLPPVTSWFGTENKTGKALAARSERRIGRQVVTTTNSHHPLLPWGFAQERKQGLPERGLRTRQPSHPTSTPPAPLPTPPQPFLSRTGSSSCLRFKGVETKVFGTLEK